MVSVQFLKLLRKFVRAGPATDQQLRQVDDQVQRVESFLTSPLEVVETSHALSVISQNSHSLWAKEPQSVSGNLDIFFPYLYP